MRDNSLGFGISLDSSRHRGARVPRTDIKRHANRAVLHNFSAAIFLGVVVSLIAAAGVICSVDHPPRDRDSRKPVDRATRKDYEIDGPCASSAAVPDPHTSAFRDWNSEANSEYLRVYGHSRR